MKYVSPPTSPVRAPGRGRGGARPRGRNALLAFLAASAANRFRNWWHGPRRVRRGRVRRRLGPPPRGVRRKYKRKSYGRSLTRKRTRRRRTKFLRGNFKPYRWAY